MFSWKKSRASPDKSKELEGREKRGDTHQGNRSGQVRKVIKRKKRNFRRREAILPRPFAGQRKRRAIVSGNRNNGSAILAGEAHLRQRDTRTGKSSL